MHRHGSSSRRGQGKRPASSSRPAITSITVNGTAPPNFQPSDNFDLAAITEPKDANGITYNDRIVGFTSSNAGIASVNASGIVTGQAIGVCTMTIRCEAASTTWDITVTNPQSAVHHVDVSPTSSALFVGSTAAFSASPEDINNQFLPGLTATWRSTNTNVATVASTGSLTATASAIGAGSANIIATVTAVDSPNVPLTVSTVSGGVTDSLGIVHPNMPSSFTPLLGNFYLTRSKTTRGAENPNYLPYWTGGAEGRNEAMEQFIASDDVTGVLSSPANGITDTTRPFQASIQTLMGNANSNAKVGWFRLGSGQATNQGWNWGRAFTHTFYPGGTRYPRAAVNKKWRTWYSHTVLKYRTDYATVGPSGKMEFFDGAREGSPGGSINTSTINSPQPLWQPRHPDNRLTTSNIERWSLNLQGSIDNNLTGVVNGVTWGQGAAYFTYRLNRGTWYSIECLVRCSTSVGTSLNSDGSFAIWMAPYDDVTQTFGVPTEVINATGLEIHGLGVTGGQGRSVIVSHQRHFQFAGSGNGTYLGADTGVYVGLDFLAGGEEF